MLAYLADRSLGFEAAVGAVVGEFASLAGLHSDGWGTTWRGGTGPGGANGGGTGPGGGTVGDSQAGLDSEVGLDAFRAHLESHPFEPSTARMLYLRFASAGSAVHPANIQPFVAQGAAFQHNGALNPPGLLLELLEPDSRAGLASSTDSELYFARIRERLPQFGLLEATRQTVSELRALYPTACLNAMLLTAETLVVVQSAGRVPPPLAAFAARGFDSQTLPPEHDDRYNRLAWKRSDSAAGRVLIVATSGVSTDGWNHFDDETVTALTVDGGL